MPDGRMAAVARLPFELMSGLIFRTQRDMVRAASARGRRLEGPA
jgi:hypothetical protein